jgi:hypothetical protein
MGKRFDAVVVLMRSRLSPKYRIICSLTRLDLTVKTLGKYASALFGDVIEPDGRSWRHRGMSPGLPKKPLTP